ncbi:hypothetical protein GUJ93_ZPchr0337g7069 [Zizania palustris]|uniref:GTP cyclohydrolase II n=1 Tax=Zizania palustris TaxID=103762 RepID=A0A8J5VCF9_ZIZPA|nr:hypothetical protein GUJ93_ZPchr0337g7069 [Zizania palustris]
MVFMANMQGDIGDGEDVLVRVHSECLTGDILGSARCDCGNQLDLAMPLKAGRGVLVYLRGHEGRGIGLGQKLRAYNLQDDGHDTVKANVDLGLAIDSREYGIGAQILRDMGVRTMRLMSDDQQPDQVHRAQRLRARRRWEGSGDIAHHQGEPEVPRDEAN